MKSLSSNLRLLALFGAFAVVLGLLRAETTVTDKAPAAAVASEPAKGDQNEPALRSLTDQAPKTEVAAEPEEKEEPAEMAEKEAEEPAPEAKPADPAPEAEPTTVAPAAATTPESVVGGAAPEEPKPVKKAKKGKTRRVQSEDQIPFQPIVVEAGQVSHEAISVGASTTVRGEVTQNAVAIFGSNKVETKARVGQEAIAVFGNLDIDGEVGKAVTVFGNLKLGPNAIVHGETVVVFGSFDKDPAAQVGKITPVFAAPVFGAFGNITDWFHRCLFQGRMLAFDSSVGWAWIVAGAHLLFYVLISLLFGKGTVRAVENLERRPGMSLLCALLSFLLTPLVIVILAIGTVTAVLIPVLIIALFLLSYFGRTVMHAWFGRLFARFLPAGLNTPVTLCVIMGGVVISLLYCVPLLGILLHSILGSIGLGAAVLTITDSMKREPKAPKLGAGPVPPVSMKPRAPVSPVAPVVANVIAQQPATSTAAPATIATPDSVVGGPIPESATAWPNTAPAAVPAPASITGGPIIPAAPTFSPEPPPAAPSAVTTPESVAAKPLPASDLRVPISADPDILPRAGFWLRMGALGIDFMLVVLCLVLFASVTPDFMHVHVGPWVLLVLAAYAAVLWKHRGTTIGGVICRIQVVRTDGQAIDWTTACIRGLGCILSAFVAGLGFIWIAVDRDQESWHDKIAGTAVVRVPKTRPLV